MKWWLEGKLAPSFLSSIDDTVFIEIPQYGIYLKEGSGGAAKYSCTSITITILITAKNG